MKKREKHHITIRPDIWEAMEAKAARNGQTTSRWLEDLVAYFGLTDKWQGHDKMNYAAKSTNQKADTPTEKEKPKITIFRNVAARPRKTKAGAVPSADETSQNEGAEAFSPEEHTTMAIKLRRGEITPEEFRDYVERKHSQEKRKRKAEAEEKKRREAEAKAAKAAERKAEAEAKRQKEKAEKAAAEENARIDRAIEKAKARAEAGEITADELKAEIDRLNDERPF